MLRQISFLFLICFAGVSTFAQTEKYTAPVKWERYKISDENVSLLLPKLPILIESVDVCREQQTKRFIVYANQIVYGFNVTSKIRGELPFTCSTPNKFSRENFQDRLIQLKSELKENIQTNFNQNNFVVNKISGANSVYWLIDDFENNRWFELWTAGGTDEKTEVKNFVKSIEMHQNAKGIEIGKGSDRMLGDEFNETKESENGENTALSIVSKPYAKYTDAARNAKVQTTIKLKVTFLANGGIGDITIANSLPFGLTEAEFVAAMHGLTEQSVAAAKKIAFIPPKKNGVTFTVAKTIEYKFSIY